MKNPRSMLGRRTRATVVAIAVVVVGGCTADREGELDYLDRVRNEFPAVAVEDLSDDRLLELANDICRPRGLDADARSELDRLAIDPERLVELALPLCPTR